MSLQFAQAQDVPPAAPAAPAVPAAPDVAAAPPPVPAPAVEANDPLAQAAQTISDWLNSAFSNYTWMHEATFFALYALLILGTFVIIERLIYYAATLAQAKRVAKLLDQATSLDDVPKAATRGSTAAVVMVRQILEHKERFHTRHSVEDVTDAAFIEAKGTLTRRLWILDTMVTAAPLLGLLGTILGIIDTFTALAQAGISDPAAVSKGIGLALFATALGIATALYGLLFFNIFHERIGRITDTLKIILLRIGLIGSPTRTAA